MKRADWGLSLLLILLAALVYGQVVDFPFVIYDDDDYVYQNPHVFAGLTLEGVRWAFVESHAANWHPLTWLSHMLDVELFGLDAGGHHLTNVLLHGLGGALLFWFLCASTGSRGAALFVAALFVVHPLRVESVAWVSERKDVLSGVFWLATLVTYRSYSVRPSATRYGLVTLLLVGALLSKPMAVTLPCVLLLVDLWPLGRWPDRGRWQPLLLEKVPWFCLSIVSAWVTYVVQSQDEAVQALDTIAWGARLSNAAASYGEYLLATFWPVGLNLLNLHPGDPGASGLSGLHVRAFVALVPLLALSFCALRSLSRAPFFFVGWSWYLGTLVPVIGLVQVGYQSHADRYAYLPLIGVYLVVTWSVLRLLESRPSLRPLVRGAAVVSILALAGVAWRQVGFWRSSETLFQRAVAMDAGNYVAHYHLGRARVEAGKLQEAVAPYQRALEIYPSYAQGYSALGYVLSELGNLDEAERMLNRALALVPDHVEALSNLGLVFARRGDMAAAKLRFERALELSPNLAQAHNNLGSVLARQKDWTGAERAFLRATELRPDFADAFNNLGLVYESQGRTAESVRAFRSALRAKPGFAPALENLRRSGQPPGGARE